MKLGQEGAIGAPCSTGCLCLLYFAGSDLATRDEGTDRSRLHEIADDIGRYLHGRNRLGFSRECSQLHREHSVNMVRRTPGWRR
jgi:hypothetical protein